MKNNIELLHFLNQVQTAISHLLQDGDIADNEAAQSTAKNLLREAEELQKKYKTCSKCGIAQTSTGICASCAFTEYENKMSECHQYGLCISHPEELDNQPLCVTCDICPRKK